MGRGRLAVWARPLQDGCVAVALLNAAPVPLEGLLRFEWLANVTRSSSRALDVTRSSSRALDGQASHDGVAPPKPRLDAWSNTTTASVRDLCVASQLCPCVWLHGLLFAGGHTRICLLQLEYGHP